MRNNHQFYINGAWVDPISGQKMEVIDPSTEEAFASMWLGDQPDTDAAVDAARGAFPNWRQSTKSRRLELLRSILGVYERRLNEMAETISREMGAPIDLAKAQQAWAGPFHIGNFARVLEDFEFERDLRPDTPNDRILYEPIGVCGLITPWNWPMNQIALKVIAALSAGCTMVLKPSEQAPLSAVVFADILHEAGVPAGVFNLVNGDGAGVGSQLSAHADVDMISFTGSSCAGRAITIAAAGTLKRVSLELGGKGANIVFADADPNSVGKEIALCFHNSGQSCNAPTRMLVERSRYDDAVEHARIVADTTGVDVASAQGPHIGPLVSKAQFDRVQALISAGMSEGARLVAGGPGRPEGLNRGFFARPTVFADCTNDMRIMREEIFGPVLSIMPFDTEDEAIAIANDTDYGLTNYVQTTDAVRARRVARALRSGMVDINGQRRSPGAPFGGMKQSGNGREGGRWGLEEFLEVRAFGGWVP